MQEPNNNIIKEHPDLYKRSIKSGYWVFALRFATQISGVVKSIIVFNFLFHQNLELIIVANLLMAILSTSTESGFHAALIQKKEDINDYLDTAWVIDIFRGILLFTLIFCIAPLFASFQRLVAPEDVPLAIWVIRAMGGCFLIRAFGNIGVVYFRKDLEFHKTFWLQMAGTITDIVLSIVLVLVFRSVWGYVIARLLASVVNLIMGYLLCSYRPKFHFVPAKARQLWRFGKWLFGGNIIVYLLNEGDDWFVSFYLGAGPLKLYRYAYRFAQIPATYITNTMSQVSFPAYAKIQRDIARLREAFMKVLQMTSMVSIPVAFLIFMLGPDFIKLFLVKESYAMIPIVQLLAVKGLLKSLGSTLGPLFKAMGKPQMLVSLNCVQLVILAILIYPLTRYWGIVGTAVSTILIGVLVNPIFLFRSCHLLGCSPWRMLRPSVFPFISSCIMAIVILLMKHLIAEESSIILFFEYLTAGIIIYLVFLITLDFVFDLGIRKIIKEHLSLVIGRLKKGINDK